MHRERLLHNEQFAPFYGSVPLNNAPHLHAALAMLSWLRQVAQMLAVSQPPPMLVSLLERHKIH